jgi:chromosome segregation ATPase
MYLSLSEDAAEANDEVLRLEGVVSEQKKFISKLKKQYRQAQEDMQVKDEFISALEKELNVQRQAARDAAMIKVRFAFIVNIPFSVLSSDAQICGLNSKTSH